MQNRNVKLKNLKVELWFLVFIFQLLVILCLCGCGILEFATPELPPYNKKISESYDQTKLKLSGSADVLATINLPEYEMLSQSKSVIASSGQKKKGYKTWLKMVAFDEDELTVRRKYLFIEDERPKVLLVEPRADVRFDCEMVLASEVLDEPYSDENARRIAILGQVLENVREDIKEVGQDNKAIAVCGMIINQALEAILVQLDSSPVQAAGLSEPKGIEFSHMTFDKGKIRMVIEDDIVKVKMRLGSRVKKLLGSDM